MKESQPTSTPHDRAIKQGVLFEELVQVAFVTMAVLNKVGADHDLSLTQLRVLGILRDRRLRMTVLADYLGLEKSTMTGFVDRAEKRGLLERAPNASDGRAVDVFLSPQGVEMAEQLYVRIEQSLSPMTNVLTPTDLQQMRMLLSRMLGSLEV